MGHEWFAAIFFYLSGLVAAEYRYCDRKAKLPCAATSALLAIIAMIIMKVLHE